jgi:predicted site-specific integrase-resolvase
VNVSLEPTLKHLSQRELSERWTIAETTLERWRSMGIGPVYVKLPGRVVYRITDVEAYERRCLRRSTSESVLVGGAA